MANDIGELLGELDRIGTRPAITFYRGRTLVGKLNYAELLEAVEKMASALLARGVVHEDRVAVLSPNRLEIPALYLAIWRLGATVVPLNPQAPVEDWRTVLRHSGARGIVGEATLIEQVANNEALEFFAPIETLSEKASKVAPLAFNLEGTRAVVLYTSGTTGAPKGVVLSQRNLLHNARSMALNFHLDSTTQYAVLPLYHAHALGFGLMSALVSGGHLVLSERFDPFSWAEIVQKHEVRFSSVVPTLLSQLLAVRLQQKQVPTLRALLVSSAPLDQTLARTFEVESEIPLIQGWGLSEYTNFACCMRPDDTLTEQQRQLFGWERPSVGGPLTGTEVAVIDASGQRLGPETVGELCIRGPSRMLEYFHNPEETERVIVGGWLRTGDEGLYRQDGDRQLFFITGRIKEIIIRDGEKTSPLMIEESLVRALPELRGKLVVLGFPHALHGEEVGVYLEQAPLPEPLAAALQCAIAALPVERRPKIVLFGSAPIPRTHTGKIQRRRLAALFAEFKNCRGTLRISELVT